MAAECRVGTLLLHTLGPEGLNPHWTRVIPADTRATVLISPDTPHLATAACTAVDEIDLAHATAFTMGMWTRGAWMHAPHP